MCACDGSQCDVVVFPLCVSSALMSFCLNHNENQYETDRIIDRHIGYGGGQKLYYVVGVGVKE